MKLLSSNLRFPSENAVRLNLHLHDQTPCCNWPNGCLFGLCITSLCHSVEEKLQFRVKTRWRIPPYEDCISHGEMRCFLQMCLLTGFGYKCWLPCTTPTVPCPPAHMAWLIDNPPPTHTHIMPCNMHDQWQQANPVGNKGYEVWQQCARWSPSSCLFLQAMESQNDEWKSDPYMDFVEGEIRGALRDLNQSKKCIWLPAGGWGGKKRLTTSP